MKKSLIPIVLVLALAAGAYFIFFYDNGEKADGKGDQTESREGGGQDREGNSEEEDDPSPLELEREQRLNERARPHEFVALNYNDRRNLLGEVVIEGSLTNNAELTMYRDFQLMIYFLDSDGGKTDSASVGVFEEITPGETAPFKVKQKGPRKTEILVKIQEAAAEDIPKVFQKVEK